MDWPIGGCCACVVRLSGHAPATWKHVNRAIRRIRRVIHDLYVLATFDVLILELPSVDEDARRIGVAVAAAVCRADQFLEFVGRITGVCSRRRVRF